MIKGYSNLTNELKYESIILNHHPVEIELILNKT
jgi:hypothetical protein